MRSGTVAELLLLVGLTLALCGCGRSTSAPDTPAPPSVTPSSGVALQGQIGTVSYDAGSASSAQPLTGMVTHGRTYPAVSFLVHSHVQLNVPAGCNVFSGMLINAASSWVSSSTITSKYPKLIPDELLLQITDQQNRLLFWTLVNANNPPQQIAVPVTPGSTVTVSVNGNSGFSVVYILNGVFSKTSSAQADSYFIPDVGGVTIFGESVAEREFKTFRPGQAVNFTTYSVTNNDTNTRSGVWPVSSTRSVARVRFHFAQSNVPDYTSVVPLQVTAVHGNIKTASGTLTLPAWNGPADVFVTASVDGVAFSSTDRIACFPNPGKAVAATMGVHVSSAGFPLTEDSYSGLWGAARARTIIRWELVEGQPGVLNFANADTIINAAIAQGMEPLVILGESSPSWAGNPGPTYYQAWADFVTAAAQHFKGRVHYWDVFNEVDLKENVFVSTGFPDSDIQILGTAMDAIHAVDPTNKTICCSMGTIAPFNYINRIGNMGLLGKVDIVSTHPYQHFAPEEMDGEYDYVGTMNELAHIPQTLGYDKPVWASEANWIIGPEDLTKSITTTPELDEHTQSTYLTRVNLITKALNIPYFVHSPFFNSLRPQVQVDTLAAYANAARLFQNATDVALISQNDSGVYAVSGRSSDRVIGAVWTVRHTAQVAVTGLVGAQFMDMYGNSITVDPQSLTASGSPIYFTAANTSVPKVSVTQGVALFTWTQVPDISTWWRNPASTYSNSGQSARMVTPAETYDYQFRSDDIAVQPNQWYVVRITLNVYAGNAGLFALTSDGTTRINHVVYFGYSPDHVQHVGELRFNSGSQTSVKLVVALGNYLPTPSDIEVVGPVQISPL